MKLPQNARLISLVFMQSNKQEITDMLLYG